MVSNWEKIQFIKLDISNWRIGKIQCRDRGGERPRYERNANADRPESQNQSTVVYETILLELSVVMRTFQLSVAF